MWDPNPNYLIIASGLLYVIGGIVLFSLILHNGIRRRKISKQGKMRPREYLDYVVLFFVLVIGWLPSIGCINGK